jgi:ribonuclease D
MEESCIAIDTESDSMYHYREKVCLIQLSSAGTGSVIVDPLAGNDPSPLGRVMANPSVRKVLHGADFDITSLKRDFAWTFQNVFDTVLAAKFLGWPSVGLAAVIKREFGLDIEKGPQTADWSVRPLPADMLAYAAGDVDYLVEIDRRMHEYLAGVGRLQWVVEESAAVAEIQAASRFPAPADFMKAPGTADMDPQTLAVLSSLFDTREKVAMQIDRPRFKVVSDEFLSRLAIAAPSTDGEFSRLRSVPRNLLAHPRPWLDAVAAGKAAPPVQPRKLSKRPAYDPLVGEAVDRLRRWRETTAKRLELDPGLLLPQRLIVAVATAAPASMDDLRAIPGLHNWRCDEFGADLLNAASRRG